MRKKLLWIGCLAIFGGCLFALSACMGGTGTTGGENNGPSEGDKPIVTPSGPEDQPMSEEEFAEYKEEKLLQGEVFWTEFCAEDPERADKYEETYLHLKQEMEKAKEKAAFDMAYDQFLEMVGKNVEEPVLPSSGFTVVAILTPYREPEEGENEADLGYHFEESATFGELLQKYYGTDSLARKTFYDRYVPTKDGEPLGEDHLFTEDTTIEFKENDPDFYITEEYRYLGGGTETKKKPCWGVFTFWDWIIQTTGRRTVENQWIFNCHTGQYVPTMGELKVDEDAVLEKDCTIVYTEREPLFAVTARGDSEEYEFEETIEPVWMYFEPTLHDLLYCGFSARDGLYGIIDWFDIDVNGEKVENYAIREKVLTEESVVTFTLREEYTTTFTVEAQAMDGATYEYGPFTVVSEVKREPGGKLFPEYRAEISLEDFLREELGDETFGSVFGGLTFIVDGMEGHYCVDYSCKVVAKYVEPPKSEEPEDSEAVFQEAKDAFYKRCKERWANEVEGMAFEQSEITSEFEKFLARIDECDTVDELSEMEHEMELWIEKAHILYDLEMRWKALTENYVYGAEHEQRYRELRWLVVSDRSAGDGAELNEYVSRLFDELQEQVIQYDQAGGKPSEPSDGGGSNEGSDKSENSPTVAPETVYLQSGSVYGDNNVCYGTVSGGDILNAEGAKVGEILFFAENAMGEKWAEITLFFADGARTYTIMVE